MNYDHLRSYRSCFMVCYFFFFQAEDGIRDHCVTGVQTCALPICDQRPGLGLVVAAMTIGNALILVSQTAVPLALPSIMSDLKVGSDTAQWVLTASILPLAGLMVLGGRLADLYGMRRMFVLGSIVFAAASLVSGLAPTFEILVAARVVQGAG